MVGPESHPQDTSDAGEVTFSSLVLMFGTTALVQLGVTPNPGSDQKTPDLVQAKQIIDLLGVLQDKTKGNLTAEESDLLESLLFDLRMRYLEAAKPG